jgi:gamma-glutamylcyclotransferase (GGCT)/AIG2-like uncharacterized protein YtfP
LQNQYKKMAIEKDKIIESLIAFKTGIITGDNFVEVLSEEHEDEYSKNILFVYGSLRKDNYNFKRILANYGKDSLIYIKDFTVNFIKMYDFGDYPCVMNASYDDKVHGEILYCNDEAFAAIKAMEEGAGYILSNHFHRLEVVNKWNSVRIPYYQAGFRLSNVIRTNKDLYPKIEIGDWNKYLMQTTAAKGYKYDSVK